VSLACLIFLVVLQYLRHSLLLFILEVWTVSNQVSILATSMTWPNLPAALFYKSHTVILLSIQRLFGLLLLVAVALEVRLGLLHGFGVHILFKQIQIIQICLHV
jgi:hypothetical protein